MTSFSILVRLLLILALWIPAAHASTDRTILVFGDSLSAGYGLPPDTGWASLLEKRLREGHWRYRVVNASISGETTSGGQYRIEQALSTLRPAIVILELGGNDGLRGLALSETKRNLEAIIAACRREKAVVLLVGMRLPPNYGRAYTEKFQNIYRTLARQYKLPLVPFMLESISDRRDMFQEDGIHPIAAAQPLILDTIWTYLKPLLKRP